MSHPAPGADAGPRPSVAVPADALVLLIGPAGAGKTTFAAAQFAPSEILSSDVFRFLVSGDASAQDATTDAFRVLHAVARARLKRGLRCAIDATNLSRGGRRGLVSIAFRAGRPAVAVVFDVPLAVCLARNAARLERRVPADVVRRQHGEMGLVRALLPEEGYAAILVVDEDGIVMPAESRSGAARDAPRTGPLGRLSRARDRMRQPSISRSQAGDGRRVAGGPTDR